MFLYLPSLFPLIRFFEEMSEAYTKPGVLYHLLNTLNQLAHTHRLAIVLTNQVILIMFFVRFRYPVKFFKYSNLNIFMCLGDDQSVRRRKFTAHSIIRSDLLKCDVEITFHSAEIDI
jgi:hypothetical protein